MNSIAQAAAWIAQHPLFAVASVIFLATVFKCAQVVRKRWRIRKASTLRIRPQKEQARFEPVRTVYTPKGYRRER